MRYLPLAMLLSLSTPAFAEEICPSVSSDVAQAFTEAVSAIDNMDMGAFESARDRGREALGCLSGLIAPRDAAAHHRLEALDAFVRGEQEQATAAFRRANTLDPEFELPDSIAPVGHPLRVAYDRAMTLEPSPVRDLGVKDDAWVDGSSTDLRPRETPIVLQLRDDGVVTSTSYLLPGDQPPSSAPRAPKQSSKNRNSTRDLLGSNAAGAGPFPTRRVVAGGAGAVALASSTALLLGALKQRQTFLDPNTPYEDLLSAKRSANTRFVGFEVLLVTGLGLGAVAAAPDSAMPSWMP